MSLTNVSRRLLLGAAPAASLAGRARAAVRPGQGRDAFACLQGRWTVTHRRRSRGGWQTLSGTCEVSPVMGGLGAIDDHAIVTPAGLVGRASLRLFDPASGQWSSWALGGAGTGVGPRLAGRLEGGALVFYGAELRSGRTVNLRQAWSKLSPQAAVWTQAVSADGGASWTADYVMEFARAD